jgi:hypothetical protein
MAAWGSFMDKYYPEGDKSDSNAVLGYAAAATLVEVLKRCGDDLSNENIVEQARGLKAFPILLALPASLPALGHMISARSSRCGLFNSTTAPGSQSAASSIMRSSNLGT